MRKTTVLGIRFVCMATVTAVLLSGCTVTPPEPFPVAANLCGGRIGYGERVTGRVWAGLRCEYTFEGEMGDIVTITMRRLEETLDPRLELQDPDEVVVAENDDYGGDQDSQIRSYLLKRGGIYTIVAGAYNDDSGGQFELTLERKP
jgi:hypothetical protein